MNSPHLLTINETCDRLRLGRTTVYSLIKDGALQRIKIGTATRVTDTSVDGLIARLADKSAA